MALPDSHLPLAPVYLEEPQPPFGPRQFLARFAGFCAGMAVVLGLCHLVANPAGGGIISAKAEAFTRTADEYDTLFVGTSRTFRWFVPQEFDAAMAEAGRETHTFNMGVPGASFYELHYVMRDALAKGGNVKRVFFEYQELMPQIDPLNSYKPRMVYWHDARQTAVAIETSTRIKERRTGGLPFVDTPFGANALTSIAFDLWPEHARVSYEHFKHWLTRVVMVGRGKDVARGLLGREPADTGPMIAQRGYVSLEEEQARYERMGQPKNSLALRRDRFLEERDAYLAHVEAMKGEEPVYGDTDWYNADLGFVQDLEVIREVAADARAAGVEFVLVVMPGNSRDREFAARMEAEFDFPVLVYNDPERFPEFYDPDTHFDTGHPAAEGAQAFTRRFAADIRQAGVK